MRISIIGVGYVGLVVGSSFAKLGNKVTFIDTDENKVKMIDNRVSPNYEPGLNEILKEIDLEVSPNYRRITHSDVIFICVGTPSDDDGSISLRYIEEATGQIAEILNRKSNYCVVAVKSTIIPGTTQEVIIPILERSGKKAGSDFGVCVVPEFLREGNALYDAMNPTRVIIGEYDVRSGEVISSLYKSFNTPILRTSLKTAEMIKYASNAFLATKISFINEIGNICKQLGIDTYEVAKGMGFDDRIGSKFLNAGIGFGGSCLPKDLKALIAKARQIAYEPRLLEEISNLNDAQALKMIELLEKHITLRGKSIGLLGLAFKPNTDDVKESRAIKIVDTLLKEGAKVKAYDPQAMENFKKLFPQIEYVDKEVVLNCDAVLIITEWEEFNTLDYRGKIVIDGRRITKANEARIYEGVCW